MIRFRFTYTKIILYLFNLTLIFRTVNILMFFIFLTGNNKLLLKCINNNKLVIIVISRSY